MVIFNCSERTIRSARTRYNLKKADHYWDKPWENYVINNWETLSPVELSDGLKRKFKITKTNWAVINKYRELTGKR